MHLLRNFALPLFMASATCIAPDCMAQTSNDSPATSFDGSWAVVLVCDDVTDKSGFVKGYTYHFVVQITNGKLEGQYGAVGAPASVKYVGGVQENGALHIRAQGNTGQPDYSVGQVTRGTRYGYTMDGTLSESTGQAIRNELRPCKAMFSKQ